MTEHEQGYEAGKKVRSELETFLPEWGNTICKIIDFFFTRREKHIVVVTDNFDSQFDKIVINMAEKAPSLARTFAKATVASMNEVETIMAQNAAEKAAENEQPN